MVTTATNQTSRLTTEANTYKMNVNIKDHMQYILEHGKTWRFSVFSNHSLKSSYTHIPAWARQASAVESNVAETTWQKIIQLIPLFCMKYQKMKNEKNCTKTKSLTYSLLGMVQVLPVLQEVRVVLEVRAHFQRGRNKPKSTQMWPEWPVTSSLCWLFLQYCIYWLLISEILVYLVKNKYVTEKEVLPVRLVQVFSGYWGS